MRQFNRMLRVAALFGAMAATGLPSLAAVDQEEEMPDYDLRYTVTDKTKKTAEVSGILCYQPEGPVEVVIPSVAAITLMVPDGHGDTIPVTSDYTITAIADKAFISLPRIVSAVLPNTVNRIGRNAFSHCSSLKSVTIPASVDTIGRAAFYGCASLESVALPKNLSTIESGMFYNCSGLHTAVLPEALKEIEAKAFYGCAALESIAFPAGLGTVGDRAFAGCAALKSVLLPESADTIGDAAFENCTSVERAVIPAGVAALGSRAFAGCDGLKTVSYMTETPALFSRNVFSPATYEKAELEMPEAGMTLAKEESVTPWCLFANVPEIPVRPVEPGEPVAPYTLEYKVIDSVGKLVEVSGFSCYLPVTASDEEDASAAFDGNVVIPESVMIEDQEYTVARIGHEAFKDAHEIKTVAVPETVSSIGVQAFDMCTSLTAVNIPQAVTVISNGTFHYCLALESVAIPDAVTVIGDKAFYHCQSLTSVALPESVTYIGEMAFEACRSLGNLSIPGTVSSIGKAAFVACDALETVSYMTEEPKPFNENMFSVKTYENAKLIMPDAGMEAVKDSGIRPWSLFRTIEGTTSVSDIVTETLYDVCTIDGRHIASGLTRPEAQRLAPGLYILRSAARSEKMLVK